MQFQKFFTAFIVALFALICPNIGAAQEADPPVPTVAGVGLGDRESAEKFLGEGFGPRLGEDGGVTYYFYNKFATQVMRLSAPSVEDRFRITEIEVFRVNRKYRERHFHAEEVGYFETGEGVFIGFKQSAAFFIAGIKNVGKINVMRPKILVKMKGEPDRLDESEDGRTKTYFYRAEALEGAPAYEAEYEFYKKKLQRFRLKLIEQ